MQHLSSVNSIKIDIAKCTHQLGSMAYAC